MKFLELDTPSLLIDRERVEKNLRDMQRYADEHRCALRPHTKTHKSPDMAKLAIAAGACGGAVAKTDEAEVMVGCGVRDIFIANEIVSRTKLEKIRRLHETATVSFGADDPGVVPLIDAVFAESAKPAEVLIEIEVGENRSGVIDEARFDALLCAFRAAKHVRLKGLFSHDGNTYGAKDVAECAALSAYAQERTLCFAKRARDAGFACPVISYGATPTFMNHIPILEGITELRPGTYIYMDVSQGNAIGTLDRCAATVLASVISKPNDTRVILDVGAKGLTMQERTAGICCSHGKGVVYGHEGVRIEKLFDEHAIIDNAAFSAAVKIGDKVRVIPVHICPVVNLYEEAYLISGEDVVTSFPIACRGKLK